MLGNNFIYQSIKTKKSQTYLKTKNTHPNIFELKVDITFGIGLDDEKSYPKVWLQGYFTTFYILYFVAKKNQKYEMRIADIF